MSDVCVTLFFIYFSHEMAMWTHPEAHETCVLCQAKPITAGYRCKICRVDVCDMCTTKEARDKIRIDWDRELKELMAFMHKNKRLSDVALYYNWRFTNRIVSLGLLVDHVKELRTAKRRAEKQIEQKSIIDNIKLLRAELGRWAGVCAIAAR